MATLPKEKDLHIEDSNFLIIWFIKDLKDRHIQTLAGSA